MSCEHEHPCTFSLPDSAPVLRLNSVLQWCGGQQWIGSTRMTSRFWSCKQPLDPTFSDRPLRAEIRITQSDADSWSARIRTTPTFKRYLTPHLKNLLKMAAEKTGQQRICDTCTSLARRCVPTPERCGPANRCDSDYQGSLTPWSRPQFFWKGRSLSLRLTPPAKHQHAQFLGDGIHEESGATWCHDTDLEMPAQSPFIMGYRWYHRGRPRPFASVPE